MTIKPFFITGATAKIRLNGKTLAFCTDVAYTIQILHQTPKILGMYEGSSVEPLGYSVNGSFTVIRYAKGAGEAVGSKPNGVALNDAGNGVGNWGGQWGSTTGDFLAANGIGNDGRAHEALNPGKFTSGTTFDIEIYQKFITNAQDAAADAAAAQAVFGNNANQNFLNQITAFAKKTGDVLSGGTGGGYQNDAIGVAKIRNARITQADFRLSKKGVAVQTFSFAALYVDEDAFVADFSGKGQHF